MKVWEGLAYAKILPKSKSHKKISFPKKKKIKKMEMLKPINVGSALRSKQKNRVKKFQQLV